MTFMDSTGAINYVYPMNMMSVASQRKKSKMLSADLILLLKPPAC